MQHRFTYSQLVEALPECLHIVHWNTPSDHSYSPYGIVTLSARYILTMELLVAELSINALFIIKNISSL